MAKFLVLCESEDSKGHIAAGAVLDDAYDRVLELRAAGCALIPYTDDMAALVREQLALAQRLGARANGPHLATLLQAEGFPVGPPVGGDWFEGAQREQVASGVIPMTTADVEQHRLTIPAGTDKLIAIRASSLGYQGGSGLPAQVKNYLGHAIRDSAGLLQTWSAGISFTPGNFPDGESAPGISQTFLQTGLGVDGDDLVIYARNDGGTPGTVISTVEWVVLDSPVPVDTIPP